MSDVVVPQRSARFGNWVEQKSPGLAGAGMVGTAVLFGGLVATMLSSFFLGLKGAAVVAVVSVVLFTATGTPLGRRVARGVGYSRQRRAGEHQWRSGVFSRNRNPSMRLPGLLGRTSLVEKTDTFGEPFVVIKNPLKGGLYTIVARCIADGPGLQDMERLNTWVSGYSRVLTMMGQEPGLVCAKAIGDTSPDPGNRLASMVDGLIPKDQAIPDLARNTMAECVADYPTTSSENVTYVELTFRGKALSRRNDEASILSELSRRVPGLLGQLASAGGGAVSMVTKEELPAIVRVAYDPAAQPFLEKAALTQQDHHIDWADAGPTAYQDLWDRFVHDSGTSVTWEMYQAPRSTVTSLASAGLLAPHSDFTRKRIAMIYRPHMPDESVRVSERDANGARVMASQSKKRMTATAALRMQATDQSRQEVASGAVMVRFSVLMTATVANPDQLEQAVSTMEVAAGTVPLYVRRCYGTQAAAFATTLPAGFIPWEHTVVPNMVRELM